MTEILVYVYLSGLALIVALVVIRPSRRGFVGDLALTVAVLAWPASVAASLIFSMSRRCRR